MSTVIPFPAPRPEQPAADARYHCSACSSSLFRIAADGAVNCGHCGLRVTNLRAHDTSRREER